MLNCFAASLQAITDTSHLTSNVISFNDKRVHELCKTNSHIRNSVFDKLFDLQKHSDNMPESHEPNKFP